MKIKYINIIIIVFIFLFNCCTEKIDTELFAMPYEGEELRIDGYYIGVHHGHFEGLKSVFVFYKNGVVLYGGSSQVDEPNMEIESILNSSQFEQIIVKSKPGWGVFNIDDMNIEFETWGTSSGPGDILTTLIRTGQIINEESFHINQTVSTRNQNKKSVNDTFLFHKLIHKPDSTNIFIQFK